MQVPDGHSHNAIILMARTKSKYSARTADKHILYQNSVQSVGHDVGYIDRLFKRQVGRKAYLFREDFCGTAALSCAWVKQNQKHRAIGVDLDRKTLKWARQHNLSQLTDQQQKRITLIRDNVVNVTQPKVDVIAAMNFSYFVFKTRQSLAQYFSTAFRALKKDGLFLLDAFGGSEAQEVLEESRRCNGFIYVWEHADFNPITGEILCHIHFKFKDGTTMRKAFTYDWRLWSLPEIQEVLKEVGFAKIEVHWEGTDQETGEGNGVYRKSTRGEAIESWLAYIVALRS